MPYNKFIIDQLAGDKLAWEKLLVFLFLVHMFQQLPLVQSLSRLDRQGQTEWMKLFKLLAPHFGCNRQRARCHNHKFDPVSIQDYYSMAAVFQGVEFGGRYPNCQTIAS